VHVKTGAQGKEKYNQKKITERFKALSNKQCNRAGCKGYSGNKGANFTGKAKTNRELCNPHTPGDCQQEDIFMDLVIFLNKLDKNITFEKISNTNKQWECCQLHQNIN